MIYNDEWRVVRWWSVVSKERRKKDVESEVQAGEAPIGMENLREAASVNDGVRGALVMSEQKLEALV